MRYIPLALAAALSLALCACGGAASAPGGAPTPDPPVSVEPSVPTEAIDTERPALSTRHVEESHHPEETHHVVETHHPEESHHDDDHHTAATPQPAEPPLPTVWSEAPPSAEPAESPEVQALSAQAVYEAVYAAAGGASTMDASFALEEYYDLSADDLEDFVLYLPDMSANIEEIFIARVKSGKLDAVKSACLSRQKGMAEDAAFYASTGAYVDSYQLVTNGDWLLFCVCEKAQSAADAFRGCTK